MNLYLIRHGEAAGGDPDPGLSARGINGVRRIAAFLRDRAGARPDRILHSSKRRAKETAGILAEAIDPAVEPRQVQGLTPNAPAAQAATMLASWSGELLVVSHLPILESLASLLLTGSETMADLDLPPGGLVALSRRRPRSEPSTNGYLLRFFVWPELLE